MPSADNIHALCIPPRFLGAAWPQIGPLLLRSRLEFGEDMRTAITELGKFVISAHDGKAQVWAVFEGRKAIGALFTEIVNCKGEKVVFCSGLSGSHALRWGALLADRIAAFARAEGAVAVQCQGGPATARLYRGMQQVSPDLWEGRL